MTSSACLSDDELAVLATTIVADDPRLPHIEACETCRAIWLHARDTDKPAWTVGRYEVRGTLGAGGLGVVLLGWDPVLQREVAIKFPAARGGVLLREAQALAAIRHRNVVAVHDFGEVDGDVYFTMERVEGSPFDTWWLGAATAQRLRALLDVAAGLGAIHTAGLVHCDIKPGNIVVTSAGDVVIVDLGLATTHGEAAVLTGGTPGYRAPELETGGTPTVTSDEFAFWCVVKHCFASAKLSVRQRRRLDAMIARGSSVDPAQRFGSMAACSAALRTLSTSRRGIVVGAAVAGTAVLAATVALATRDKPSSCDTELSGWTAEQRGGVVQRLVTRPDVLARVIGFVDRERKARQALLARSCAAPQDPAWLRTRWCVLSSWQSIDEHVRAIAKGRDIPRSLDELPLGIPADRCAPGGVTASPPAVDASATPESRKLLAQVFDSEGLPPDETIRQLTALGPAITKVDNAGLTAAWHLELADAYRRAGNDKESLASALAAVDVATRNGDDIVLGRARLTAYLLRDVPDRSSPTRDSEVEALITRTGSPGLLATFHNAAAQRAMALDDVDRARTLLERAIATHAAIELAPSSQRGASEQNLGVALQFSRRLDDAQLHLDRAAEIFVSRYGKSHEITAGARMAAASNRIYRGQAAEGARELDALADELSAAHKTRTELAAHIAMVRCQAAMGLGKDALVRCHAALSTNRAVFGKDHVEIVPALLAVAQVTMAESGRAALPFLAEAIAIAEKQANNPTDLPYARGLYALALELTGRPDEGLAIAKQALGDLDRLGQKDLARTLRQQFPAL